MKNPLNGRALSQDAADYIEKLREVRRNARKAARSGNPAKRAPAQQVLKQIGPAIAAVYRREVSR